MSKVHIGRKIKEVWRSSRMKGTEFAASINRDRQVIYDIFKRESIDTDLLKQISKVLKHDFFRYYSSDLPIVSEPQTPYDDYVTKMEFDELKELVEKVALKMDEHFPEKKSGTFSAKTRKASKKS